MKFQKLTFVLFIISFLTILALSNPIQKRDKNTLPTLELEFTISTVKKNLDKCPNYEREVIVVYPTGSDKNEAKFPAPAIIAKKSQPIQIKITNDLTESTTIHWHGLYMVGTTYSDGVPALTQCPIQPDWFHNKSLVLLKEYQYNTTSAATTAEPVPYSVLINGQGQGNCEFKDFDDTEPCEPEKIVESGLKFSFKDGEEHRIHVVNGGALVEYFFSIDGHTLKVIEVEGMSVVQDKNVELHRVPIHVSQRYTIIATRTEDAKKDGITNFWMRMEANPECIRSNTECKKKKALIKEINSRVYYGDENKEKIPTTERWSDLILWPNNNGWSEKIGCTDLNLTILSPKDDDQKLLDNKPYRSIPMSIIMKTRLDSKKNYTYTTIGSVYEKKLIGSKVIVYEAYGDDDNTLKEVYTKLENYSTIQDYDWNWPTTQNVFTLKDSEKSKLIEIAIDSADDISHPFHLHGHAFWVVEADGIKFKDPIKRDTATVSKYGRTRIQFTADNAGVWAFHCHIEWHSDVGMVAQIIELPEEINEKIKPNTKDGWYDLCQLKSAPSEPIETD
ncbi:10459_t:CDS:2 [Dentiscutata erythropus]|uniref:10459_t:CDS:1 n=1 Tax=Dentiscutata erythropus TaxID=1348616 RepID=A0A9N9N7P7_9GLOM|nr:10459_t:CDS:2 [Dentiscutata erythropus]